ncbi:MAG: hypothetical protein WCT77_02290 [Bacteroidota bacterium]
MLITKALIVLLLFMANINPVQTASSEKRILFIHHSTGGNLIKEGNLRDEIKKLDPAVQLWDHNYNLFPIFTTLLANNTHLKGLSDAQGKVTGKDYNIVVSNNSPKEYADIFSRDPNDSTLKAILIYDVIAFKNCYPTTRIISDQQLDEDIKYYTIIRDNLKKYSEKQFLLLTPPPARRETTNIEDAKRATKLVSWLNSQDLLQGIPNIHIFDFFGLLADKDGMLKKEYQRLLPWDSHPNKKANLAVAPVIAEYIVKLTR